MLKDRRYDCAHGCPVEAALDLIGGRWKSVIVLKLLDGPVRFNALGRMLPNITQRMLTRQLRELEEAGLVRRTVHPVVPPHVEYALTQKGETLRPVIAALYAWGVEHVQRQQPPQPLAS